MRFIYNPLQVALVVFKHKILMPSPYIQSVGRNTHELCPGSMVAFRSVVSPLARTESFRKLPGLSASHLNQSNFILK